LEQLKKDYMLNLFHDSIGFAGAKLIRRIIGVAHVADLESIENIELRASCERRSLNLAIELLLNTTKFGNVRQVTEAAKKLETSE